jgi:hypothetical protein
MTGTTGIGTLTITFAHAQTEKPAPLGLHVDVPPSPLPHEHATCVPGAHRRDNGARSAFALKEIVVSAAAIKSEGKSLTMV